MKEMYLDTRRSIEADRFFSGRTSRLPVTLEAAAILARDLAARAICAILGHRMTDDSTGGPETGCAAAHCERCGYSFHVTLY